MDMREWVRKNKFAIQCLKVVEMLNDFNNA